MVYLQTTYELCFGEAYIEYFFLKIWKFYEILGKFVEILENTIGQHSTNSVNGGNKRMFSRSQYVFFQVKIRTGICYLDVN
jgi:hypothetical protein